MKKLFLLFVLALAFLPATADEYTDPATKVVYSYEPGSGIARVGYRDGSGPGSPDAKGEIAILERFTVDGQEYVVDMIYNHAFTDNKAITAVTVPPTVQEICSEAFMRCSSLTSVSFSEGLKRIWMSAFDGSGVTSLELPDGLEEIEMCAFAHCNRLKSVRIPSNIGRISEEAFIFCDSLETIVVDEGNDRLDSRDGCNAIVLRQSPDDLSTLLETIPEEYHEELISLWRTDVLLLGCGGTVIPSSVGTIAGKAFYSCTSLKGEMVIPDSVVSIESEAFYLCKNLKRVTLPQSLSFIGANAFMRSGLETVTIPSGVKNIQSQAFAYIPTLTRITSLIEEPLDLSMPICDETGYDTVTLYVPTGTKEKYMAAEGWKDFAHIVEIDKSSVNDAIVETDAARSPVYDLQGRRLSGEPTKGMYIKDGRKYAK
ncbi:MAG: leucine-rich repeat domain-containing protein [Prevotella sp.]|nr:leucine-rich repeat domain-containing protein [Prevotella sp.]